MTDPRLTSGTWTAVCPGCRVTVAAITVRAIEAEELAAWIGWIVLARKEPVWLPDGEYATVTQCTCEVANAPT
jgi:hypothetical protein